MNHLSVQFRQSDLFSSSCNHLHFIPANGIFKVFMTGVHCSKGGDIVCRICNRMVEALTTVCSTLLSSPNTLWFETGMELTKGHGMSSIACQGYLSTMIVPGERFPVCHSVGVYRRSVGNPSVSTTEWLCEPFVLHLDIG